TPEPLIVIPGVSIHAPARGATSEEAAKHPELQFQSTRPRGARRRKGQGGRRESCFNPRARAGRDWRYLERRFPGGSFNPRARAGRDGRTPYVQALRNVSIHAPARGATSSVAPSRLDVDVSIHAPARGATI